MQRTRKKCAVKGVKYKAFLLSFVVSFSSCHSVIYLLFDVSKEKVKC